MPVADLSAQSRARTLTGSGLFPLEAPMPHTIRECDQLLLETRERYLAAEQAGDITLASRELNALDALLDERLHIPQQR